MLFSNIYTSEKSSEEKCNSLPNGLEEINENLNNLMVSFDDSAEYVNSNLFDEATSDKLEGTLSNLISKL